MAEEGTYNAGTIFLQVVPVFRDTLNKIKREAKEWNDALGDELEDGGEKAGERGGKAVAKGIQKGTEEGAKKASNVFKSELDKSIADLERSLKPIQPKFETKDVRESLKLLREDFEELKKVSDRSLTPARYREVESRLEQMRAHAHALNNDFSDLQKHDFGNVIKGMDKLHARMDGIRKAAEIEVRWEDKQAERTLNAFQKKVRDSSKKAAASLGLNMNAAVVKIRRELEKLSNQEIGVDISAEDARKKIVELDRELIKLAKDRTVDIEIKSLAAGAHADLMAVRKAANLLDGKDITLDVDIKAAGAIAHMTALNALLSAFRPRVDAAGAGGDAAANSFRSFSFVVLGVVLLLPALIPLIGALGGGLLALIPIFGAVGAGLGTLLLGFSGIGEAVKAMGAVQENASKDSVASSQKMRDAAWSVADAQRGVADAERSAAQASADAARQVADARRSAAEAIESALERQRDAAEEYRDAVRDVREAEADLREARKRAAEEEAARGGQTSTKDALEDNKLAQRQGVVDLFNATVDYNTTMADGAATNLEKEQASINLEEAREALEDLRIEEKKLRREQEQARKAGTSGSAEVESAQDALTAALERQREAQEAVREAAEEANEARIEGARMVADALRNQQRTEADGARSVADANRNLERAQVRYQDALVETGEIGSASFQNLETAMDKLSPAGRRFARFLFSLRDNFYRLRGIAQAGLLPGVQESLEGLIKRYGPGFNRFIGRMARVMGDLFVELGESLRGPAWEGFFGMMDRLGPKMLRQFGRSTLNWMEVFASIMTVVAPFSEMLSEAMLKISERAAKWARSSKGMKFWQGFMEYAAKVGPKVADFFWSLVRAGVNLGKALAPWGAMILSILDAFVDWIANMDPKTLGIMTAAIITLVLAWQAAVGITALVAAGTAAFATTAGAVLFAIVLLVGALVAAYLHFDTFREIVNEVAERLSKVWTVLWDNILKPVFKAIIWWLEKLWTAYAWIILGILKAWTKVWVAVKAVYEKYIKPVINAIGDVLQWLWAKIIRPVLGMILDRFDVVWSGIKKLWDNILYPIFDLFGTVVSKLWSKFVKPTLSSMKDGWDRFADALRWVWKNVLKPMFDAFMDVIGDDLVDVFETAVDLIKDAWDLIKKYVGQPIVAVLDFIINKGLIAGFNKIANFVGSKEMKPVSLPDWSHANGGILFRDEKKATGGVLPGYTPGQDVHHFSSPTAGRLHLSGGEAILRPEWTRAVGSSYVDKMNQIARAEGPKGVRRAMGMDRGYFLGGVLPVRGAHNIQHTSGYSGYASDMNYGSGYDDYGMPVRAWKKGKVAQMNYIGDQSYGRWVVLNHDTGQSSLYAHLSNFAKVYIGQAVRAGQTIGYVGDVGNTGTPPTSHLHFEVNGAVGQGSTGANADETVTGSATTSRLPSWLRGIITAPARYFMDQISDGAKKVHDIIGNNPLVNNLIKVPAKLVGGLVDKTTDIVGNFRSRAVDTILGGFNKGSDALGLGEDGGDTSHYRGGILPFNGTMMYDSGGYLAPGVTQVVNMTGKPEPVFTNEQFDKMSTGSDGFTYAPTFNQSDLTAAEVADDLDFAFRAIRREGRYSRSR